MNEASCIDPSALAAIRASDVTAAKPFPWCQPDKLIRDSVYHRLLEELPQPDNFRRVMGKPRRYGQASHDRFALDYRPGIPLSALWHDFVNELNDGPYRGKIAELLARDDFFLTCHWHYTPTGCSVSPHCDATWKLGSQIFYFNDEKSWDPRWGGSTVVLDDGGSIGYTSAPKFEDFRARINCEPIGNRSLLFLRTDHSWHGVESLSCPEDEMRKVFIVEFRKDSMRERFRARTGI